MEQFDYKAKAEELQKLLHEKDVQLRHQYGVKYKILGIAAVGVVLAVLAKMFG